MATKNKTKNKNDVPYVIKSTYVTFVHGGQSYSLNDTNPLYARVVDLLINKKWKQLPSVLNLAVTASNQTHGKVKIERDIITYNGTPVHDSLAQRIIGMLEAGKSVANMLIFMDRLHQNPNEESIQGLYDALAKSKTPITDDGCFPMYKVVKKRRLDTANSLGKMYDLVDCHTGTITNNPGQMVFMLRADVDHNRNNHCSHGLHVCTLGYLGSFGGEVVIEVKVDPRDVVSVPNDYNHTKMRVSKYEVLRELGAYNDVKDAGVPAIENSALRETNLERQQILRNLLKHRSIQRNIRLGRIAKTTIQKMTYGRLLKMWEPLAAAAKAKEAEKAPLTLAQRARVFENPIGPAREAAGLTRNELAIELDVTYKSIYRVETNADPSVETIERFMTAIKELTKSRTKVISFPVPAVKMINTSRAKGVFDQLAAV
jgi:DNA-binding XRE family transcriptional regulator